MLSHQPVYDHSGKNKTERGKDIDVRLHHKYCLCKRCLEYDSLVTTHPKHCKICKGLKEDEAATVKSPVVTDPLFLSHFERMNK